LGAGGWAVMGGAFLPEAPAGAVEDAEAEVAAAAVGGGGAGGGERAARGRLAWALAHSAEGRAAGHLARAKALLQALLSEEGGGYPERHEALYLLAVAHFRLGEYARARWRAREALELVPEMRQARALKLQAEDELASEGLIGLGIVGGAAMLGVSIVAAFARSSRPERRS